MTAKETQVRIESELAEIAAAFGDASDIVRCEVEVDKNKIAGKKSEITSILGALSFGTTEMNDDDRLYIPIDVELEDNETVNEERFEKNLAAFKEKIAEIRDRVLSSSDYDGEIIAIIDEFDKDAEARYRAEMDALNRASRNRLIAAASAAALIGIIAAIFMVIQKII